MNDFVRTQTVTYRHEQTKASKTKAWKIIIFINGTFVAFTAPFWLILLVTGFYPPYWDKCRHIISILKWWLYWQPGEFKTIYLPL